MIFRLSNLCVDKEKSCLNLYMFLRSRRVSQALDPTSPLTYKVIVTIGQIKAIKYRYHECVISLPIGIGSNNTTLLSAYNYTNKVGCTLLPFTKP